MTPASTAMIARRPGVSNGTLVECDLQSFASVRDDGDHQLHVLEGFYDNPGTRDLLWSKSEEATGGTFTL